MIAVDAGGPAALIAHRATGLLYPPRADLLAEGVLEVARSPRLRARLGAAGVSAARARTWEDATERFAAGYRRLLQGNGTAELTRAA